MTVTRFLRPIVVAAAAALLTVSAGLGPVAVQAQEVDSAFSDTLVRDLGLPEVAVTVSADGVSAPAELPTGPHVVTFAVEGDVIGYLNLVRMPDGLNDEERQTQMFAAGVEDQPQPGWTYYGGTNTPAVGETATFITDLEPGSYTWAASTYVPEQDLAEGEPFEEIFHFAPLTIVAAAGDGATPAAAADPAATVTLEMTDDLRYLVSPERVPAGPQLWELANTGHHQAHHVVMFRVPDGTTAEQISSEFASLMSGTPPAGEPLMAQFVWVGYAALQSGGATTRAEFDLDPATYAVACFIIDAATGQPHLVNGMVTVFQVA